MHGVVADMFRKPDPPIRFQHNASLFVGYAFGSPRQTRGRASWHNRHHPAPREAPNRDASGFRAADRLSRADSRQTTPIDDTAPAAGVIVGYNIGERFGAGGRCWIREASKGRSGWMAF